METMGDPAQAVTVSDTGPRTKSQQITGYVDDAADRPSSLPLIRAPASTVVGSSMETRVHSIVDVLSRPVLIGNDTWSDSQIRDDIVFTANFPDALFDASANLECKVNYFAFLRADVCIRVLVNANTFQAGKLLGYFTPFEPLVGNRNVASDFTSSYTVFPHIELDASTGNTAEICIPYVAPYSSYRLTDKVGNIGTFYLNVLNPLKSGECTFTVYAWLTNISVDMPSGKETLLSQNSEVLAGIKRALKTHGTGVVKDQLSKTTLLKAQVAGEDEQKSSGIISATAHQIAAVTDSLTKIPILADVAAPVSWVAKAIAGVAEYFGYSKSQNLSVLSRYANVPGYGFTNASGVDSGVVLGCTQDNQIEPRGDVFGSAADDMSIPYICKHKSWITSFEFSTNQDPNTLLTAFPVAPGWCQFANEVYQPGATAWVASMFNFWRGGLKYRISAAKTAYHSGRIRIIYLPGAKSAAVDEPEQAYNWVLDLRNSSEIEFTIPYNNIIEWSDCVLGSDIGMAGSIGVIRIEVLNELRAPSSVSPTIEFNIWIAGESDLQFAIPTFQKYVPSLPDTPEPLTTGAIMKSDNPAVDVISHMAKLYGYSPEFHPRSIINNELKAQVLGNFQDRGFNDMADKPHMFSMSKIPRVTPCKTSMGEYVDNLRYLTRRFGIVQAVSNTGGTGSEDDVYYELPSYYFTRVFNPLTDNINTYRISPIDYISWAYRFFRGGIRWKFLSKPNGLDQGYQEAILINDVASARAITQIGSSIWTEFFVTAQSFWHRVYSILNPVLEITVPFYSQTPIRPIVGGDTAQPALLQDNAVLYHSHKTGSGGEVDIMKAAHDDFSFGWLVGPPALRPRQRPFIVAATPATIEIIDSDTIRFSNLDTVSTLPNGGYNVIQASPTTVTVAYTDATTSSASIVPAIIVKSTVSGSDVISLTMNHPEPTKTVDTVTTLANFNSVSTYEFLVSGPL